MDGICPPLNTIPNYIGFTLLAEFILAEEGRELINMLLLHRQSTATATEEQPLRLTEYF